jgi:hypothetical protein
MIVAAWAVPVTFLVAAVRGHRLRLVAAGTFIAVVVPYLSGCGLGGWSLLADAVPNLGRTRTYLSMNAQSSFVPTTVLGTTETTTPQGTGAGSGKTRSGTPTKGSGAAAIAGRKSTEVDGRTAVVNSATGEVYGVEDDVQTNLRAFPRGLVAVTVRPFPWESTTSLPLGFARAEQLAWYVLYALAVVGCWAERRRWRPVAGAVVLVGGILVVGAVTQGNLGTAFRHRGQILWAVAVLAACGGRHVAARWRERSGAPLTTEA